jgi:hypothetical protein
MVAIVARANRPSGQHVRFVRAGQAAAQLVGVPGGSEPTRDQNARDQREEAPRRLRHGRQRRARSRSTQNSRSSRAARYLGQHRGQEADGVAAPAAQWVLGSSVVVDPYGIATRVNGRCVPP